MCVRVCLIPEILYSFTVLMQMLKTIYAAKQNMFYIHYAVLFRGKEIVFLHHQGSAYAKKAARNNVFPLPKILNATSIISDVIFKTPFYGNEAERHTVNVLSVH